MFYSISGAEQEHVDAAGGGENADVEGAAAGGAEGAQRAHGRRRGHMKPGPRWVRGHVTMRSGRAFTREFLCLKKRTGYLKRGVQTLREALVATAGGEAATPQDVVVAALAALSTEEKLLAYRTLTPEKDAPALGTLRRAGELNKARVGGLATRRKPWSVRVTKFLKGKNCGGGPWCLGFLSGSLYFQCSWKTDHAHIQSVLHCLACTSNQTFSLPCTLLQAQACTHSACQADARVAKRAADVTLARARVQLPYRLPHLSICVLSATARPGDPRCVCSRPLSQLWWQTMGPPVPAPVRGARVERGSFLLGPKTPTGR